MPLAQLESSSLSTPQAPSVTHLRSCDTIFRSKFAKLSVGCPSVQFECGGVCVETEKLKGVKDYPNFGANSDDYCKLSFELFLPTQLYYAPPLNIRVFDNRKFGRKPLVGVHSVGS